MEKEDRPDSVVTPTNKHTTIAVVRGIRQLLPGYVSKTVSYSRTVDFAIGTQEAQMVDGMSGGFRQS